MSSLFCGAIFYHVQLFRNFPDNSKAVFERDLNPARIIHELSVKTGETIYENETLIIFDEIQACERALTSCHYFHFQPMIR